MNKLLAFEDVYAGYGEARDPARLRSAIGAGERVAMLGRNGVGKTTVVNTFLGIARLIERRRYARRQASHPTSGISPLRGSASPWCRRAGASFPNLTVRENLHAGRRVGRKGPWTIERLFEPVSDPAGARRQHRARRCRAASSRCWRSAAP